MKKNIHPQYKEIKVICSCGNSFTTSSTFEGNELHVDICSNCHPFYTGKQKIIDAGGRVDRFKQRYKKAEVVQEKPKEQPIEAKKTTAKKSAKKTVAKKVKEAQ